MWTSVSRAVVMRRRLFDLQRVPAKIIAGNAYAERKLLFHGVTDHGHQDQGFRSLATGTPLPNQCSISIGSSWVTRRNLNIFTVFSKEKMKEERAKLEDEMTRGYFEDFKDLKASGGKLGSASVNLLPASSAIQFPLLPARTPDGGSLVLPTILAEGGGLRARHGVDSASAKEEEEDPSGGGICSAPDATLITLAFRASAQPMVESWSCPFAEAFKADSHRSQLYEVSLVEPWLFSLYPIQSLLLRLMKTNSTATRQQTTSSSMQSLADHSTRLEGGANDVYQQETSVLKRRTVYSFGNTYHLRKSLVMPNRLTAYAILLDKFGRVRWRASGMATEDELGWMVKCTRRLFLEQQSTLESVS